MNKDISVFGGWLIERWAFFIYLVKNTKKLYCGDTKLLTDNYCIAIIQLKSC